MDDSDSGDIQARDHSLNIYQRISNCAAELGFIDKDKEVKMKGGGYGYISHDAVTAAVRVQMIKHGIAVHPTVTGHEINGNRTECKVKIDFVNIDAPDDRMAVDVLGYGVDSSDKGPGKALSYAVKYAYMKVFMLNSADDVEAETIVHDPQAARQSDVAAAQNEANKTMKAWAESFKVALEGAQTLETIDALQRENKSTLMDAPGVTKQFFVDLIEKRKKELGDVESE